MQEPGRPGPVELIGHMTTATHAGDRGVATYPSDPAAAPSFCLAYLDGFAREMDDCAVGEQPLEWEGRTYPWTVSATWRELDVWDEPTVKRLSVHAFDERGQPMARWSGQMDENAGHLTE